MAELCPFKVEAKMAFWPFVDFGLKIDYFGHVI